GQAPPLDDNWWNGFGYLQGPDGRIRTSIDYQGDLVVGGDFTHINGASMSKIARWNGSAWQPVGNGLTAGVGLLALHSDKLVAYAFIHPELLWVLSGNVWTPMPPPPVSLGINAMASFNGHLFVGGDEQGLVEWD